jgi:hypothetical protein
MCAYMCSYDNMVSFAPLLNEKNTCMHAFTQPPPQNPGQIILPNFQWMNTRKFTIFLKMIILAYPWLIQAYPDRHPGPHDISGIFMIILHHHNPHSPTISKEIFNRCLILLTNLGNRGNANLSMDKQNSPGNPRP